MKNNKYKIIAIITVYSLVSGLWSESLCMDRRIIDEHNTMNSMRLIDTEEIDNHPHSSVLSLKSVFKVGDSVIQRAGTCFLIGDGFALTAAHVVFHKGVEAHKVECYIGRHGDKFLGDFINTQTNSIDVKKYIYASQYESDESKRSNEVNLSYDYAMLYLGGIKEISIIEPPIIPVYYYTRPINQLMLCGYPGKSYNECNQERDHEDASFPYEVKALFDNQTKWTVSFSTPCFGGMSGSPIRFTDDGRKWNAIAILASSELKTEYTYGCLITKKKIDTINKWKEILPQSSSVKEFYNLYEEIPFIERMNLDKGSPHIFSEKDDENCVVS